MLKKRITAVHLILRAYQVQEATRTLGHALQTASIYFHKHAVIANGNYTDRVHLSKLLIDCEIDRSDRHEFIICNP
jgi:hypothetical protein